MSQTAIQTPGGLPPGQKPVRPFGMRDKMGYLLGDFGNDFSFVRRDIIGLEMRN